MGILPPMQRLPEILLSGDHEKIDEYRYSEQIRKTKELRPDLIQGDADENKN